MCVQTDISCPCTHGHLGCRRSLWMVSRMPSCVTKFEGGMLIDAVHGLYLKSTQAKWYAPRVHSTCVKYVGLIFIDSQVMVILVIENCVTEIYLLFHAVKLLRSLRIELINIHFHASGNYMRPGFILFMSHFEINYSFELQSVRKEKRSEFIWQGGAMKSTLK